MKAVIWDLDGTLIHFKIDYKRARAETIQILEKYGYPKGELTQEYYVLKMIQQATKYFSMNNVHSSQEITQIKKEIDKKVENIERKASYQATAIQGIHYVLKYCIDHQLKMGIITLNTTKNALISLKSAELDKFFPDSSLIIGRDLVTKIKPDPEHALTLLERLNVSNGEICIIGDHPSDIEVANRINSRSIGIISKKHTAQEFETPYIVNQTNLESNLIKILDNFMLNGNKN